MDLDVALPFETDVVLPDGPVATRSRSDGPRDPEGRAEPAVEVRRTITLFEPNETGRFAVFAIV